MPTAEHAQDDAPATATSPAGQPIVLAYRAARDRIRKPLMLSVLGVFCMLTGAAMGIALTFAALFFLPLISQFRAADGSMTQTFAPLPAPAVPTGAQPFDVAAPATHAGVTDEQRVDAWLVELSSQNGGRLTPQQLGSLRALIMPRFAQLDAMRAENARIVARGMGQPYVGFVRTVVRLESGTLELKLHDMDPLGYWVLPDGRVASAISSWDNQYRFADPATANWRREILRGLASLRIALAVDAGLTLVRAMLGVLLVILGVRLVISSPTGPMHGARWAAAMLAAIAASAAAKFIVAGLWPSADLAKAIGVRGSGDFVLLAVLGLALQAAIALVVFGVCTSTSARDWAAAEGCPVRLWRRSATPRPPPANRPAPLAKPP